MGIIVNDGRCNDTKRREILEAASRPKPPPRV